ncbi:Ig-like domain-containing protein [Patescibacteria group bacterium]|nr:Ig-like domain-containing protein [Patescibacteria group bacterium]
MITNNFFSIREIQKCSILVVALFIFFVAQSAEAANPLMLSQSPSDNAIGAAPTNTLSITFDQVVQGSGGSISLYKSDGTLVEAIAGNDDIDVSGSGTTTITISLTGSLLAKTSYYVLIATGAVANNSMEDFAIISDTSAWNFITGGGGSGRARRIQILNMIQNGEMEAYSDTESPVWTSSSTPTSTSSPVTEPEHEAAAELQAKEEVKRTLQRAQEAREQMLMRPAAPQSYISAFHERVCKRVMRLFDGNMKMLDRVNTRLRARFSFTCY